MHHFVRRWCAPLFFMCAPMVREPDSMSVLECVVTPSNYCQSSLPSFLVFIWIRLVLSGDVEVSFNFIWTLADSSGDVKIGIFGCSAEVGGWAQCPCQALCAVTLFTFCLIFLSLSFFQRSSHVFPSGSLHRLVHERCFQLQVSGSDSMSVLECIVTLSIVVSNSFPLAAQFMLLIVFASCDECVFDVDVDVFDCPGDVVSYEL